MTIRYYLDDVTIIDEHAQVFSQKFREISELCGFELHGEKSHRIIVRKHNNEVTVDKLDSFTHLDINILNGNNNIGMKCIKNYHQRSRRLPSQSGLGFKKLGMVPHCTSMRDAISGRPAASVKRSCQRVGRKVTNKQRSLSQTRTGASPNKLFPCRSHNTV